eukprot:9797570-Alexandrium_andersonii.AAC.1
MFGGAPAPFGEGALSSGEQARVHFPYRGQEEKRAQHVERLKDERLKGTALEHSRHYCANCFAAVL